MVEDTGLVYTASRAPRSISESGTHEVPKTHMRSTPHAQYLTGTVLRPTDPADKGQLWRDAEPSGWGLSS